MKALSLPENLFEHLSPKLVELYRQRASTEKLRELRRHPDNTKYALIAAFCHIRLREITDNVIQLVEQIFHKLGKRAEKKVVKDFVADLKRVHGKQGILFKINTQFVQLFSIVTFLKNHIDQKKSKSPDE